MHERRHIPRAHYPVFVGDQLVGEVTSGTFSPTLGTGIALAYLWPGDVVELGQEVEVDIRGRRGAATVVQAAVRGPKPALAALGHRQADCAGGAIATKSWMASSPKRVRRISSSRRFFAPRRWLTTATTT